MPASASQHRLSLPICRMSPRARSAYARSAAARAEAEAMAAQFAAISWDEWLAHLNEYWEQGEHMTALGHTGGGKTTALVQTLDSRKFTIAILTKRRDDLFPTFEARGYKMLTGLKGWNERPEPKYGSRIALHLPPTGLGKAAGQAQADQIRRIFHDVWDEGKWTLYLDEIATLGDQLNLNSEMRQLWKEARSSKITLVAGTQRPARIPIEAYSQPRYLLLWRTNDRDQLKRLSDMNAVDPEPIRIAITRLKRHEFLIVDTRDNVVSKTMAPKLA